MNPRIIVASESVEWQKRLLVASCIELDRCIDSLYLTRFAVSNALTKPQFDGARLPVYQSTV